MDLIAMMMEQGHRMERDGLVPQAEFLYRRIAADHPDHAEAFHALSVVLVAQGRRAEAIPPLTDYTRLRPDDAEAHNNLGSLFQETGDMDSAAACYRRAVQCQPQFAAAHYNHGITLEAQGRGEEAIAAYRAATQADPGFAEPHINLGAALQRAGLLAEAVEEYRRAIALAPHSAQAHNNLGVAMGLLQKRPDAIQSFRHAIALAPADPQFHFNLALVLLLTGQLREGWAEYEWRRQLPKFRCDVPLPDWKGESLAGKRILLTAEQGFGDTLQFVRYAPLVGAMGGRVTLKVPPHLVRLFATMPGIDAVVADEPIFSAFDFHLPLMSLPHIFGTDLATIPAETPYLHPAPAAVAAWGERLAALPGLKVGLAWAGNPHLPGDDNRSLRLEQFAPLAAVDGITFVSLQKHDPARQAKAPPPGMALADWMDEVVDFADTAALIANLDLVISVDSSMAHLAGALGRPVWVLARFNGCWRWMEDREDSPWYPTARLFRQTAPNAWAHEVDRIADELRRLAR